MKESNYIDGKWQLPETSNVIEIYNPANQAKIATLGYGGKSDAKKAIESATAAQKKWAKLTGEERSLYLRKLYDLVMEHMEELSETITTEMGKPLSEARGETLRAAENFLWYAEEAKRIYGETVPTSQPNKRIMVIKQPVGVVGAITPWNVPLNMIVRKIAPALAAGCAVVVKPSEYTPLTAIKLFELFDKAEFPNGVVNLVIGDAQEIGEEFINNTNVRKITFTGSTRVGKYLMAGAAKHVKKISLELGGHAPFIVFEDANLDEAVEGLLLTKFNNNGQTCTSANRIYVHKDVVKEFTDKLLKRLASFKVGSGLVETTNIGPLINKNALEKVLEQIQDAKDKGGTIVCGGSRLEEGEYKNGYFIEPTVITNVSNEMVVVEQETFGPIVPIITFENDEDVIEQANNTPYGLAGYFYTKDIKRCFEISENLEFGIIGVNDGWPLQIQTPFGGLKESGIGVEGGYYAVQEFLETKFISFNLK